MGGLFSNLFVGMSSLRAHQLAMNVVSNNVANVNTPGYSRQRAVFQPDIAGAIPQGLLGTGVTRAKVESLRDRCIERQINQQNQGQGELSTLSETLRQIEGIFSETSGPGVQAAISKFFPGGKTQAARLEEALFEELLGPPRDGNPLVFDDEYICSGGQLYELTMGHDRFLADLRPIFHAGCLRETEAIGGLRLCCHPYDLASDLVAREAGVIVTGPDGGPLAAPLDIRADVAWIGYANDDLRRQIEPVLHRLLAELL